MPNSVDVLSNIAQAAEKTKASATIRHAAGIARRRPHRLDAIAHGEFGRSPAQSPWPGSGDSSGSLSGLPSHSAASGGESRFTVMFGHFTA